MKVMVLGASGFVGSAVVKHLQTADHELAAVVRTNVEVEQLRSQGIETFKGDITDQASLVTALTHFPATVVVDLVGIIQEHPPQVTFENVHVVGTRTVVAACLATSVQKLVYISALGADLQGPTRYYQTKAQAEELIKASGLSYTILRPSLMFGQGAGFTQQLVQQIKRWPVIPIVGSGLYQFQPIAVDVTADCVVKALPSLTDNRIYDLVGPEFLSLAEITQRLAENLNIVKPKIHVPVWLLKIVAGLEALGVKVPITRDQLVMLTRGSTGDGQAMRQDLHPEQIAFKSSGNYPLY